MAGPKEPVNLYMSEDERSRMLFGMVNGGSNLSAELRALISACPRIIREEHRGWVDSQTPAGKRDAEDVHKPVGIPAAAITCLPGRAVFMGPTQIRAIEWCDWKPGAMTNLGLLIWGPTLGKTIAAAMTISPTHIDAAGMRRLFVSEAELLRLLAKRPTREEPNPIKEVQAADRLVVDHMGALEPGRKAMLEVVEFLRGRWERGRQNVLTTRKTLTQFTEHYGAESWATFERFCTLNEARKN